MRYGVIDPYTRTFFDALECESFEVALRAAGLKRGEVDFAQLTRPGTMQMVVDETTGAPRLVPAPSINIVVYEWGLTQPGLALFALRTRPGDIGSLFAGGALLFAADESGATVDFVAPDWIVLIDWFADAQEAEFAIRMGRVDRPRQSVNGVLCWEWSPP